MNQYPKYRIIVIIIFSLFYSSIYSQNFWEPTNGPYQPALAPQGFFGELDIAVDDDIFIISTDGVYHSTTRGESWSVVYTAPYNELFVPDCVETFSSNYIFVGTTSGQGILRSKDNGDNWEIVNDGLSDHFITNIAVNSEGILFAGTYGGCGGNGCDTGGVFRSTNFGDNWERVDYNLPRKNIRSIVIDNVDVLYVGTNDGFFISTDYGNNWNSTDDNLDDFGVIWIYHTQENIMFVQTYNYSNGNYSLLRSEDGGNSWIRANYGIEDLFVCGMVDNPDGSISVALSENKIYRSTDLGESWFLINNGIAPPNPYRDIYSFEYNSKDELFVSNFIWGAYKSLDQGYTWEKKDNYLTNYIAYRTEALVCYSDSSAFVGSYGAGLFRTTNNGKIWYAINDSLTNFVVESISLNSNRDIFAVVSTKSSDNCIVKSTDNGKSWRKIYSSPDSTYLENIFVNAQDNIFASFGIEGFVKSTDNGETWVVSGSEIADEHVYCFATDSHGVDYVGTFKGIYKSTNEGTKWEKLYNGYTENLSISYDDVIYATGAGTIIKSIDSGQNWIDCSNGLPHTSLNDLAVHPNGNVFVCTDDGVFQSVDDGNSWKLNNTGLAENAKVYSMDISSTGVLLIGTLNNGVYRSVNPISNVLDDKNHIPVSYSLLQNYPNPFNPTTQIIFQLPYRSKIKLEIFDILGQKMITLLDDVKSAGEYKINFNASNFTAGVYIYRLIAKSTLSSETYTKSNKMILLK